MTLRHDLSDADRVKVYVLLAAQVVDGEREDVADCRAALEHDPIFAEWANSVLEGLA